MQRTLPIFFRVILVVLALPLNVANAQTVATAEVSSGAAPQLVFEFDTPPGATGMQMVVAKFLTNDMGGDALTFRVEPTTIALVVKMITLSEVTCCQLFHFLRFLKAMETHGAPPGRLST